MEGFCTKWNKKKVTGKKKKIDKNPEKLTRGHGRNTQSREPKSQRKLAGKNGKIKIGVGGPRAK